MQSLQSLRIGLALSLICIYTYTSGQTISPEDLVSPTEINHDLYGFNGEYMMDQCFDSDDPESYPQAPYSSIYLSQACKELVDEVSPGVVRFPGGITANFYHFNGNGYGLRLNEILFNPIGPVNISDDFLMPVNFIEPFADLVLQTNSKVIFTLNIFTHFKAGGSAMDDFNSQAYLERLEENMDALQYLVDRGVDLAAIELGNEMYSYPELTSIFNFATAIDRYVDIGENYATVIHDRFPGIPIGVPISVNKGFRNENWNQKMKDAHYAEGRVIHEYERLVYDNCVDINERNAYFECAKTNVEAFFDGSFEAAMLELHDIYPDKELWLTEWGIAQAEKVANTFFDAYYVFKYWNAILEFEKAHPDIINFALRHNLIATGWSYSAFAKKYHDEAEELDYNDGRAIHASAYPSKMMAEVYDGNHDFIGATNLAGCDAWVFRSGNGNFRLSIANEEQAGKVFNISELETQLGLNGLSMTTHSYLSADNYFDAAGTHQWGNGEIFTNDLNYVEDLPLSNSSALLLSPLSLNVIHVEVGGSPELPNITEASSNVTPDCEIDIVWQVANDVPGSEFVLAGNIDDQNLTPLATINSNGSGTYNYTISPSLNGIYYSKIYVRYNGEIIDSSNMLISVVNCVPTPDPQILGLTVTERNDCSLDLNWVVSNEIIPGHYAVMVSYEGQNFEQVGSIYPFEEAAVAVHQFNYTSQNNGNYQFRIDRILDGDIQTSSLVASYSLACIPSPDPYLVSFRALMNQDCSLSLDWIIGDENTEGTYSVQIAIDGGPMQEIAVVYSSGMNNLALYGYNYYPESNGSYYFMIERRVSGQFDFRSNIETYNVNCIANPVAVINSFNVVENQDCSLDLEWEVTNENTDGVYQILMSVNGSSYSAIGNVNSVGDENSTLYNFMFVPVENGNYAFQIERLEDGEFQTSSDVLEIEVSCIDEILPAITAFSSYVDEDCKIHLAWSVIDQNIETSTVLLVSNGNDPAIPIDVFTPGENSAETYSYFYDPIENGDYVFQLELWHAGENLVSYSTGINAVSCFEVAVINFSILPAFTFGNFRLGINSNQDIEAEVKVVNAWDGAVSFQENVFLVNGYTDLYYNMDSFPNSPSGVYKVIITYANGLTVKTLVYFG